MSLRFDRRDSADHNLAPPAESPEPIPVAGESAGDSAGLALRWATAGFLLASVLLLGLDRLREGVWDGERDRAPTSPIASPTTVGASPKEADRSSAYTVGDAGSNTEPLAEPLAERLAGRQPECWLGVVVARQAVTLGAQEEGRLQEVRVRVGEKVEAGQVLARIDTRQVEHRLAIERAAARRAQAEVLGAELEVARAAREHHRRQQLSDVLSAEELERSGFRDQEASADLAAAQAEAERLEARIRELESLVERAVLRAPFRATVAQRFLDPGSRVGPGTPIVRLIDAMPVLRFAVPPDAAAASLAPGSRLWLDAGRGTNPADPTGHEIGHLEGIAQVENIAPEVDTASRLIFVEAVFLAPSRDGVGLPEASIPEQYSTDKLQTLAPGTVLRLSTSRSQGLCWQENTDPLPRIAS